MADPDFALNALKQIIQEFSAFVADKCSVSEADTRVKLRLLSSEGSLIATREHRPEITRWNPQGSAWTHVGGRFFPSDVT
jgi:hypothetical protein